MLPKLRQLDVETSNYEGPADSLVENNPVQITHREQI